MNVASWMPHPHGYHRGKDQDMDQRSAELIQEYRRDRPQAWLPCTSLHRGQALGLLRSVQAGATVPCAVRVTNRQRRCVGRGCAGQ